MKFGRTYQLMVEGRSGLPIYLQFPLTLEFSISHTIFASANTADFSLYSLSSSHRSEILFDQYFKARPYKVTLNAGYISQQPQGPTIPVSTAAPGSPGASAILSSLPQVFTGYVNVAYTDKNGSDLVTHINAFDNGDITDSKPAGNIPPTFSGHKGDSFIKVVQGIMKFLNNVKPGAVVVTPTPPPLTKDRAFVGSAWENLQKLVPGGGDVFIENGTCYMLGPNDALPQNNSLAILSSDTGLLNIPKYMGTTVLCQSIFEPSLAIGKRIDLASDLNPSVNGPYKVIAYSHHGTISGVVSGDALSDITLQSLNSPLVPTP